MKDPLPTFTYFVRSLRDAHPRLAYIHLTEPRVMGSVDRTAVAGESNDVFREIWHAAAEGTYPRDSSCTADPLMRS